MSLRRQNIAKKAEANTDSVEPNYGLYEQLGPPSRDSHIYPAPPIPTEAERTEVEIIEEILEPPSPPFAQGRISCRIRAMFAGDRPTPRVTVAVRRVPPRTPVPPTSEGVVPYLESPGPAKKDPPKEKRLSTITAPTSVRQGCRYPWEPKRRPPPVPLPEIQQSPQTPPPIIFPRFKLSPREKEDVIQDGMDLYEPVSSYFDDFYGPFSDQASGGCPVNPQKEITGSSSLSHERSGLVKNISAWKQYPPLGKILCFQPDSGEIIGEDALSEYPPPPTRAPPSPPISHPVNKVTDSWFSDSEGEEEEEDSFYAPCSKRNKNEAGSSFPLESRLKALAHSPPSKGHKVNMFAGGKRDSKLLPPAIHVEGDQRPTGKVKVETPLFSPETVTTAALLLGTGRDIEERDSMKVAHTRPVVHYRDLTTAGDRFFTWRDGVIPRATRKPIPTPKDGKLTIEKSTNRPKEFKRVAEEEPRICTPSPVYSSSEDDKLSINYSHRESASRRPSMETVRHTPAPANHERLQVPFLDAHWVPFNKSPSSITSRASGIHSRIFNSLANLTVSKSAPQPSFPGEDKTKPPKIPQNAGKHTFRIKGAGPWIVKYLSPKKLANPFTRDNVPPKETKELKEPKKQVYDPNENYNKFMKARAKEEKASHQPGRRRQHLGQILDRRSDC